MTSPVHRTARLVSVVAATCALTACAALTPDRSLRSTMTLAPGQSVTGRFTSPGGDDCLVQLQRRAPKTGVAPYPGATTWTNGDARVLIAFPDDAAFPAEQPLGYASQWLRDGAACRVVVRNTSTAPATFDWIVTGTSDAVVDWDASSSTATTR
jgi:hypothetical protein